MKATFNRMGRGPSGSAFDVYDVTDDDGGRHSAIVNVSGYVTIISDRILTDKDRLQITEAVNQAEESRGFK